MTRRLVAGLLVGTLGLLAVDPARADEARRPEPRLAWSPRWPRFRLWEYAGTAIIGGASYYIRYHMLGDTRIKWQGRNVFDDTLRGWLRAGTPQGRELASGVSDVLSLGGYVMPFAIDLPIVLLGHREPRVAWQLLAMDAEAFAVSGLINNVLFYEVGRGRPSSPDCARDPRIDPFCNMGGGSSFPSGHVLVVSTGAGLTCVHHRYLPIYGEPGADAGACAAMSLLTVVTAVARVRAYCHYATDALTGVAIGFGTGYGLPWLLHYRSTDIAGDAESSRPRVAIVPFAGGSGRMGLGLVGLL